MKRIALVSLLFLGFHLINPAFAQLNKAYFFYKGEELLSQQQYAQALPYLNTLISIDSTLSEGWFLRGVAKYNLGDIYGAISDFDRVIKVNPVFAQAHHYKAIALNRISQSDQALKEITAALELKPNSSDFMFTQGIIYFQMQNFPKAIEMFSKVIRTDNSNPDVWINRGSARLLSGDTLGALSDYNIAIKVNPFYSNAYSRRGILNAELNKPTLALSDLNQAIILDSLSMDNYFNRALVYYNLKEPKKALADLNKVLEIDPKYSLALFNRAIISYQIDNWQIAIDDLTKLTSLNPENVMIYYYRGSIFYEKGMHSKAIADYSTAINIFPDFANAYINRAEVKARTGDLKGSEADYKTGQDLLEKYKGTDQQNFFSMLDSSGKFKKLISLERDFNSASKLSLQNNRFTVTSAFLPLLKLCLNKTTKNPNGTNINSQWLDSLNQILPEDYQLTLTVLPDNRAKEISLQQLDSALNNNPNHALIRGIALTGKGRYANAKMEYANAVAKNSKNPLVALSQIVSNTDMARYIESFGTESESISITNQPSSSKSETTITAYNDAIESLSKLSEIGNGITAYNTGNIYILINNFSEAINWYNKSIAENATMSCAYYNRGLALLLTGSKTKGCTDLSVAGEMGIPQAYDALKRFCEK